ncbi:MAG TPA: dihydrodipicolinate synthase family protein [Candidatus Sulfopaludibacter sp.]|nr:dihydrodipicolinate synthase family protein [Candidatus Sulfopaludibacter sp.]
MTSTRLSGVWAPAITPFQQDLSPDPERFARHARWLLANGCSGLAAFGTNSEANSLDAGERRDLLDYLTEHGVEAARLMPGTGCCALTDSVRLTAHAVRLGCAGVLMLPPFYYKGVTDDGLFRNFAEVIERVGDARLRMYLYHIPPVAQVAISIPLIERLIKRYPGTVAGLKDSSGDWNNTKAVLDAFSGSGFEVFAGSEVFLLRNMQNGGVGCISATANVNPAAIHHVFENWQCENAGVLQDAISATRAVIQKYPMIPALKAIVARGWGDEGWTTVRPPLMELPAAQRDSLAADLNAHGFKWGGPESE